jgi:hypothetical protein
MHEISRLFGVDSRIIDRWWIHSGLLLARRWRVPRPGDRPGDRRWAFDPADVEAFIRTFQWAYDWQRMDQHRPLGKLAEIINRADPWLSYAEVARYLGKGTHSKYWLGRGLIPHRRRSGEGSDGRIMVRAKDLPSIAAAIEAARQHPCHRHRGREQVAA